jgi:histone H3/H4
MTTIENKRRRSITRRGAVSVEYRENDCRSPTTLHEKLLLIMSEERPAEDVEYEVTVPQEEEEEIASIPTTGGVDDEEEDGEEDLESRKSLNENSVADEDESVLEADERMDHTDAAEDDEMTVKSEVVDDDDAASTTSKSKASTSSVTTPPKKKKPPPKASSSAKKGRSPSVAGLTIPFRTVKKAMKLDPDIPIVQNEAAIMTTIAAEAFLKKLAKKSYRNARNRGRHTIRYEDVAEARTQDPSLSFLEPLLP